MIKSVINANNKEKDFPKLMEFEGLIVLMRGTINETAGSGTVMLDDSKNWKTGEYCENWDILLFEDFDDSVTLSNT